MTMNKKSGGQQILDFTKAMASVKKMTIDENTGQILNKSNESILEDVYNKSGQEIPVEVKKVVEDKKEQLEKSSKPVNDTVAAYYAMINGTTKEQIVEQEQQKAQTPTELQTITVKKLPNEEAYMAALVAAVNKKR